MTLSPEQQAFHDRQSTYVGNINTQDFISDLSLTMEVGPTKSGKTSIAEVAVSLLPNSSIVDTTTTRNRRPDDPAGYHTASDGVTPAWFGQRIIEGEFLNYSVHPSGHYYGTMAEDCKTHYNFLPTLPDSVASLERAGFKETNTVYVVLPVKDLHARLGNLALTPAFRPRMEEIITSGYYAKRNIEKLWFIDNKTQPNGLRIAAQKLVDITLHNYVDPTDPQFYLDRINGMVAYAKSIVTNSRA